MLDPGSWLDPTIEWTPPLDRAVLRARFEAGERLTTWPAEPFEQHPTDCFTHEGQFYIWQPGVGAVRFVPDRPHLSASFDIDADAAWFHQVVTRNWLPAVYPFWGRQVIHASAAAIDATGQAVAFTGFTHAGKSTTAYGVSRRPGWRLLADDTLAFSVTTEGQLCLHPIGNTARLRPASADFFGRAGHDPEPVEWPSGALTLRGFYALEPSEELEAPAEFTRLRMADALPLLLQQAYALSFKLPKYNQQLMRDYAQLAASVPLYRLRYRREFSMADALYAAIDAHAVAEVTR
jgi:hypothetical protein